MDNAPLLAIVIDHVKELKRKAAEIGKVCSAPTEVDEVSVECDEMVDPKMMVVTFLSKLLSAARIDLNCW